MNTLRRLRTFLKKEKKNPFSKISGYVWTRPELTSRKSSIKPSPPSPWEGAYLFHTHLRGGGLFNLAKTVVSVLLKE